MTDLDVVYDALPADGSFCAFANVQARLGQDADHLFERLQSLAEEGRAELVHGAGWRRADVPRPTHDNAGEDYLATVAEIVGRAGHMVQWVSGSEVAGVAPFAYTVGLLWRVGAELVITGALDPALVQALLNDAAALDPFPTARGVPQPGVMRPPYSAVLLDTTAYRCAAAGYPLNVAAVWNHRAGRLPGGPAADFPVVQVVWPDSGYRYPWSHHFDYRGQLGGQPLLADPPAGSAP